MIDLRIVYIGCVEFSYYILEHLMQIPGHEFQISGIVTKQKSEINSDFVSLTPLAKKENLPVYYFDGNHSHMADWLRNIRPDVIYCFGWSHILPSEILEIPPLGVIGYHPAPLPFNRGRHPIIWTLALGLSETASTFFFMDEGADSGDILDQQFVSISPDDDAGALYKKLIGVAKDQVIRFTEKLINGTYERIPQNHEVANYWRKRSKSDGQIDWRMGAVQIHNLVRALARPYPGAHCIYRGQEIKIWKTKVRNDSSFDHIEPGKIVDIENDVIHVKCGTNILMILDHEFVVMPTKGEYL